MKKEKTTKNEPGWEKERGRVKGRVNLREKKQV